MAGGKMSIFIDGHVHIHPAFDLDQMLDAAWDNFFQAAKRLLGDALSCSFVLLLAEGGKNDLFSTLVARAGERNSSGKSNWEFRLTEEANSVLAIQGEKTIVLIAGRQLISRENIELLSLFCPHVFDDNTYSLGELAERVVDEGGLPLLTWGVGKWFGRRGRVVQDFLAHPPVPAFLVGDNGNRPRFWPYPSLLDQAEKQGILSLAGSDPLPLAAHALRAGSCGGWIKDVDLDSKKPANGLKEILSSEEVKVLAFGQGPGLLQFTCDQVQVNVQKRLGSIK
ncbi:MAG: hypothetical protein JRF04_01215 [Deltaproteobacteria bacterium]|nr:hypothetical protein [Deltaproteobacteria bacterium]